MLEATEQDPASVINRIRWQLDQAPGNDDWLVWGRWFLADRATRTISPFSKVTIPEFIENRFKENTAVSLAEAEQLVFGNTNLLQRIAQAEEGLGPSEKHEPVKSDEKSLLPATQRRVP